MHTKFAKFGRLYIFYSLQHLTTKLCNFTKFRMLFPDVAIFLPVSNFFKIPSKRLKVQRFQRPLKKTILRPPGKVSARHEIKFHISNRIPRIWYSTHSYTWIFTDKFLIESAQLITGYLKVKTVQF